MKKTMIGLCALSIAFLATGQRSLPAFGKVSRNELEMTSCSFEPSANAMVLFDQTDVNVVIAQQSSKMTIDRRIRIKIFNEQGFKHASIQIPYFSRKKGGKIKNLKAVIHSTRDGKLVTEKLDSDDFFKLPAQENLGVVKFTFPNLRPGSIIEYSYTLVKNNVLQIEPWFIQRDIPVAYSSIWITNPHFSTLATYPLAVDSVNEYEEMKTDFIRRTILYKENMVSFSPEPFMSSHKDYIARVVFHFFPSGSFLFGDMEGADTEKLWKFIGRILSPVLKEMAKVELKETQPVVDQAKKIESLEERIRFLYDTTRNHMHINTGQTLLIEGFEDLWTKREGTSTEINLVMLNLLARSGISSHPILISTRENGRVHRDYPGFGQFNGIDIMAYDTAKLFILDPSTKYSRYDLPPINILNREALLLDDEITWIKIEDDRFLLRQDFIMSGEIQADGTLKGSGTISHFDYAKQVRLDSTAMDPQPEENEKPVGFHVTTSRTENAAVNERPIRDHFDFTLEPQVTGEFHFFNPQSLSSFPKNLFKGTNRKTDVDLGSRMRFTTSIRLKVNDAWEIESLPKNVVIRAPDSSIIYYQNAIEDTSGISYTQVLEIRREIFQKEEYPGLQEFFGLIASKVSEDFVLRKKTR